VASSVAAVHPELADAMLEKALKVVHRELTARYPRLDGWNEGKAESYIRRGL
jgi:hypothetical protein